MFTERDVMNRVIAQGRDPQTTTVEQVMTPEPTTVAPSASIVKAFDLMVEGAFRHLPVVDGDGHVIGVVSMRDVPLEYRILHQQWSQWMAADGSTTAVSPV
jgi:CBS domain-containing protein